MGIIAQNKIFIETLGSHKHGNKAHLATSAIYIMYRNHDDLINTIEITVSIMDSPLSRKCSLLNIVMWDAMVQNITV